MDIMNSLNKVTRNFRSNKYDDFLSTLIFRLTFEQIEIVCRSNVKYSSSITPKSVNFLTNGIFSFSHFIIISSIASMLVFKRSILRWYFHLNSMAFDFLIFKRSRLCLSQSATIKRSLSISDEILNTLGPARYSVVSSANIVFFELRWDDTYRLWKC